MNIYQLHIEVMPTHTNPRFGEYQGAFVSIMLSASDLEESISKMKLFISTDSYELVDIEYVRKIDLEDYEEEKEENDPSLKEIQETINDNSLYYYGALYTYASEYEH